MQKQKIILFNVEKCVGQNVLLTSGGRGVGWFLSVYLSIKILQILLSVGLPPDLKRERQLLIANSIISLSPRKFPKTKMPRKELFVPIIDQNYHLSS